jgi:hypothetical protein
MRLPAVLLLLAACGTRGPAPHHSAATAARQDVPPDTMPPRGRTGMLVTHAVTERSRLDDQWQPHAGVCAQPRSFQLLAQGDSVDLLLLLELPADSVAAGVYSVVPEADSTAPARVARLGVQQLQYGDFAYQATGGSVRLARLDQVATGSFDVTLEETPSHQTLRYLGVFDAIPVDTLSGAACRLAAPDTAGRTPRPTPRRKPA